MKKILFDTYCLGRFGKNYRDYIDYEFSSCTIEEKEQYTHQLINEIMETLKEQFKQIEMVENEK